MVQPLYKAFIAGVVIISGIYLVTLLVLKYQTFVETLSAVKKMSDLRLRTNEKILRRFERTLNVANLSNEQKESITKTIENTRMEVVKMMLEVDSRTKQKVAKMLEEGTRINEMLQSIMGKKKHVLLDNISTYD